MCYVLVVYIRTNGATFLHGHQADPQPYPPSPTITLTLLKTSHKHFQKFTRTQRDPTRHAVRVLRIEFFMICLERNR